MPELPEVERAAGLLRSITQERPYIRHVEAEQDVIVFSQTTHLEFVEEIKGRTVLNVGRYGKLFYMELDGDKKHPVLHFGMTGMLQIKGEIAVYYRETPRKATSDWPPRFVKFILSFSKSASDTSSDVLVAFLDARRLGRIRLCASPLKDPPISELGFDPILSMPTLDDFQPAVLKRKCPIKALLLDQSFSAGVGNWVADEILYHARIHPETKSNTLSADELKELHHWTRQVCTVAVAVNADDSKFPENWLFKHRWGKGKGAKKGKKAEDGLKLPSGETATIKWVTVGGRTSAFVVELQRLRRPEGIKISEEDEPEDSDLTPLSDEEVVVAPVKRKRDAQSTSASSGPSGGRVKTRKTKR